MIAVDTNVLLRYITKDHCQQTEEATAFLSSSQCMILHTVLLETGWALSSKTGYNWERTVVVERFRDILGLPTVFVRRPKAVFRALAWYESGMDFADALHLANSDEQFVTFDRRLSKKSKQLQSSQEVILLGQSVH
ncbi:MAG: type II toxin-antitoxin system VapC family toxin [Gammaproteobacteria bacterium]|nr:type II toxin-antitoxin system VapC family toxin [Gammaproteobacteria bacterium]